MSDQRIDTGAEAATGPVADPGEGLGTGNPSTLANSTDPLGPRAAGGDADLPQPRVDQPASPADPSDSGQTEGASYLQEAQGAAEAQQSGQPDLSGREPATGTADQSSLSPGAPEPATTTAPRAETGEVSAPPSPERRAEDPGSVEAEFADRADSAPEDDIARPSI